MWVDPETGVHWLVVAGLAKGGHEDHDDFYVRVAADNAGNAPQRWLPTELDRRLLKRETAARLITEWELTVQVRVLEALRRVHAGGTDRFTIDHPLPGKVPLATLTVTVNPVREPDYESDDIVVGLLRGLLGKKPDDLIFAAPEGGVLRVSNWRRRVFNKAVKRLVAKDATFPVVTPHDLRHTAASLAISAGANVKAVQTMLGHKSAAITLDTYTDLFPTT